MNPGPLQSTAKCTQQTKNTQNSLIPKFQVLLFTQEKLYRAFLTFYVTLRKARLAIAGDLKIRYLALLLQPEVLDHPLAVGLDVQGPFPERAVGKAASRLFSPQKFDGKLESLFG